MVINNENHTTQNFSNTSVLSTWKQERKWFSIIFSIQYNTLFLFHRLKKQNVQSASSLNIITLPKWNKNC